MTMLQLYVWPGSTKHDLPSLDPQSLVAASYLQLLRPGQWQLIETTDPGVSPTRQLPLLKDQANTFVGSAILHHLLRTSPSATTLLDKVQRSESKAFEALLDTTVLPLVLHSLYSLPKNWHFFSRLLAPSFSYPTRLIRPAQLRESAHDLVDATQPSWWNLGGEAEKEEEMERKAKKALLAQGTEGVRERKEEDRREGKERVRKAFGEGKIIAAARRVFDSLEQTLASSSTPFFFSSTALSPIDAQVSSLLSLILYLPLPTPLLADLINASFPRLWAHTALLRRTLWSSERPLPSRPTEPASGLLTSALKGLQHLLVPSSLPWSELWSSGTVSGSQKVRKPMTKKEQEFAKKRWIYFGVVAFGAIGWGLGTGKIPLPWRIGKVLEDEDEAEYDWVVVEGDEGKEGQE